MIKLDVYVAEECWACTESRRIIAEVAPKYPDAQIQLLDINDPHRPDNVFATPTYVLDDRIIFMGNPTEAELQARLDASRKNGSGK